MKELLNDGNTLDRTDLPELDLILWDYHERFIDAQTAFTLYEQRWGYVDSAHLSLKEADVIQALTERYGKGLFLAR